MGFDEGIGKNLAKWTLPWLCPPPGQSPREKPTHSSLDATWIKLFAPKGKNMFLCTCFSVAIYLVMYSNVTGSSTVSLWLWHSTRARFTRILASAVKPDKKWRKILKEGQIVDSFQKYSITCKSHDNVVIQRTDFSDCSWFLKFGNRFSLYSKNNNVFTTDSNL